LNHTWPAMQSLHSRADSWPSASLTSCHPIFCYLASAAGCKLRHLVQPICLDSLQSLASPLAHAMVGIPRGVLESSPGHFGEGCWRRLCIDASMSRHVCSILTLSRCGSSGSAVTLCLVGMPGNSCCFHHLFSTCKLWYYLFIKYCALVATASYNCHHSPTCCAMLSRCLPSCLHSFVRRSAGHKYMQ
jgi:hypothetical protein